MSARGEPGTGLGSEKREQEQAEYQIQMKGEYLTKYLEI